MSTNKAFISKINGFQQSSSYLDRPRLRSLFEDAINYPMVAVYAGSGYGKTRAIYSFLREYNAYTTWIQLSERDNEVTRFWENYTNMISLSWPEVGVRLMEIGFPETEEAFAKYTYQRSRTLTPSGKFLLVYDDFHLLHNPVVLRFFERATKCLPPNGTVILISRTMPEINITSMMLRERIFMIREDCLCFTEDEIAEYFNQLALPVTRQDIRDIYDDTRGWAFAINIIGRSLSKNTKYERYALAAMKENIFKLIETETSQIINGPLWNFLLRISLIDHLATGLIMTLADDDTLIKELDVVNAYIRYDYHLGAYMIHHLFLDYLRQHQNTLSDEEKRDTYNKAGVWCENNNYQTDALSYYEKAGNYDAIMRIVYMFNLQISQDMAKYAAKIFDRIPKDVASQHPLFPSLNLKIKMSLGLLNEASVAVEQYISEYKERPETPDNIRALAALYGAWAIQKQIMSPSTHVYDFDVYYEKMREYYDKKPFETFGPVTKQPVGAYALLIGTNRIGAPDEYIEALSRAIPHTAHTLNGNLYGLDDLARGELFFYQRNMNGAEQYLNQALDKSRAKEQYDIQSRTLQYLMLVAISRSDLITVNNILQQLETLLEVKDYTTRYEAYDIARSHYFLAIGQPEQVPDWLKSDFENCAHPAFMENCANRIRAHYRYLTRQYSTLLAFLENVKESHILLLGRIEFKVLESLSLYQLKRKEEAIAALTEAYTLAAPNKIIIPFTQYSKDMRTLTAAALKDSKCSIPAPWLDDINRKASAFARRQTHMMSANKFTNGAGEKITLTNRETQILKDLSKGLSRSEIAASQDISLNTVKMVINTIYDKLCVTSVHDALRIAIARKII
jgi:LuxR family maltose regulon positive regulatory protein